MGYTGICAAKNAVFKQSDTLPFYLAIKKQYLYLFSTNLAPKKTPFSLFADMRTSEKHPFLREIQDTLAFPLTSQVPLEIGSSQMHFDLLGLDLELFFTILTLLNWYAPIHSHG